MPKTPRTYRRLTRPSSSVGSYNSLWLAADHLLLVKSNGYTEDYQRLQLRDIKGFFVVGANRRLYWGLAWGIIVGISGLIVVKALVFHETPIGSVIVLVPALVAFIWNLLLGPGCRAFVVTGVQTALLPSLVRQPKARKVIGRLQPLIEAAQADLGVRAARGTAPARVNTLSPPPGPSVRTDPTLHTRRCVRHGEREAAARCPACGRFFCRECVVEHEGRLLCAECLARSGQALRPGQRRWQRARAACLLGAAIVMTWLAFYAVGSLLLKLPPAFHEGTLWQTAGRRPS